MLQVAGLSVQLGGRRLVSDVTLTARPGAITAIAGPNGSGKTTLLRAVTGELRHDGSARLNGHEIARMRPRDLAAIRAVLAQSVEVAFPFTVAEVVRFGLISGLEAADAGIVERALAAVDLQGHAGRPLHLLSGGEQQRAHLARALAQVWRPGSAQGPHWLFLDEPVASLDIAHQLMVMRLARSYADAGGGVVAVMHDLNLTAMFADHMVLMQGGRLVAQGRPEEVMTDATLSAAYSCRLKVNAVPAAGAWLLPQAVA